MYEYEDIEDYMRKRQPGRKTLSEYYPDSMYQKKNENEFEEPDSFIGAQTILKFCTQIRKHSGNHNVTTDKYKTSQQLYEEIDDEEITYMLRDLNVFGSEKKDLNDVGNKKKYNRKKSPPKRTPRSTKNASIKKSGDDLMPLMLDESFFKLTPRRNDSNTDSNSKENSSYYSENKEYTPANIYKEYTPREVYLLNRKKWSNNFF